MPLPLSIEAQKAVKMIIDSTNGKFFRVVFKKRTNQEERIMDCRTGVGKFVLGVGLKFNPAERGLIPVWDLRAYEVEEGGDLGYRFIPLENVKRIKFRGIVYHFHLEHNQVVVAKGH